MTRPEGQFRQSSNCPNKKNHEDRELGKMANNIGNFGAEPIELSRYVALRIIFEDFGSEDARQSSLIIGRRDWLELPRKKLQNWKRNHCYGKGDG